MHDSSLFLYLHNLVCDCCEYGRDHTLLKSQPVKVAGKHKKKGKGLRVFWFKPHGHKQKKNKYYVSHEEEDSPTSKLKTTIKPSSCE
ncbi:hypothetical protein NQ315_001373 [Exocentrus adspersus]|uniref:Uncharacterized protein n=1 Tax=Exocentrus adspersus TaxID=1586481 RepID=A0AAV8WF29_9CUCU|nr:hypothetical protein NQ315_001373 [Exocentrus adspersus]